MEKVDTVFLKRLRRSKKFSEGVVQLGSSLGKCNVGLFPLITHSVHVRRRVESIVESTREERSGASRLVIDLPDCPGDEDTFKIVDDFCYGLLDDNDISISNVVKLVATSKFLEIGSLECRAVRFLEESVFTSWESCLSVLLTFDYSDPICVEQDILFDKCKAAFLSKTVVSKLLSDSGQSTMRCNVECLLRVAEKLPPSVAESIYQSCRAQQLGLSLYLPFGNEERCCLQIPLCTHFRGDPRIGDARFDPRFYPIAKDEEANGIKWMQELPKILPDWSRRSSLLLHLAKSIHGDTDVEVSTRSICGSRLKWSFLCALLAEATELRTRAERTAIATHLDKEIVILQSFVGKGLGESNLWSSPHALAVVPVLVHKFKFNTLLCIVSEFRDQFRDLNVDDASILSLARILDKCLLQHLEEKTFTLQQALWIYREFPIDARPNHDEIYHTFEKFLREKALCHSAVLGLSELLDYRKLSDKIVEEMIVAENGCDPQLVQHIRRIEKEKNDSDFSKLQNSYEEQTADLLKVKNELAAQSGQTAELKEVVKELSIERVKCIKLTADKLLVDSQLVEVRHDLQEEKEKSTCKICYTQPRDALCLPCMHFLYCTKCLQKHQQRRNTCPTCRSFTSGVLKCNLTD